MAVKRVLLGGQQVAMDDQTGELVVKVADLLATPVIGEVSSADAHAGVAMTLYIQGVARVLAPTETLVITDFTFVSTAGGTYALVADSDAPGKRIFRGVADAHGGLAHTFATPFICPTGVMPKLIAAAGQVDLVVSGYIRS